MENNDLIKRISFQIYELTNKLEIENEEVNKKEIIKKLKKIDSQLLKHFKIKLSDKDKDNALELMKILK